MNSEDYVFLGLIMAMICYLIDTSRRDPPEP